MIFRLSFLVVASVAALAVSLGNSSSSKHSDKNGSSFQQIGGQDQEEEFTENDEKAQKEEKVERVTRKIELQLRSLVRELEKRKLSLERKLLELYGVKEQHSCFAELRSQLEDKMVEIDELNGTVNLLGDEIKNLQNEMKQVRMANYQLKMAKKRIEELQMKMDANAGHRKRQLVMLEEQVYKFRFSEEGSINGNMVEKKLEATRQVGLEYMEMQRRNKELELEKRELMVKVVDARARITSLSNMTQEDKIMAKIAEEMSNLRQTNGDLSKQIERLQRNRFNMVEELVYQSWLNSCLRFEIRNYQTPSGKACFDLSTNANHKCDKKAEQLVPDHSYDSISSCTSLTESSELDSSTTESSWNSQGSITKKSGLMHITKTWGRSEDDLSAVSLSRKSCRRSLFTRNGLMRRHSTSLVPSNRSSPLCGTGDTTAMVTPSEKKMVPSNAPHSPRARRVSFSDSVEKFVQDKPKSVEYVIDDIDLCTQKPGENTVDESSPNCLAKFAEDRNELSSLLEIPLAKPGDPSDSSMQVTKHNLDAQVSRRVKAEKLRSKISTLNVASEDEGETSLVHLLLLFLLMLLLYFSRLTARIY